MIQYTKGNEMDDFTVTDMTQVLQEGMWIGSQTTTMFLFFACIVLFIAFAIWYEFFSTRTTCNDNKSSQKIKDAAKKMAKKKIT